MFVNCMSWNYHSFIKYDFPLTNTVMTKRGFFNMRFFKILENDRVHKISVFKSKANKSFNWISCNEPKGEQVGRVAKHRSSPQGVPLMRDDHLLAYFGDRVVQRRVLLEFVRICKVVMSEITNKIIVLISS